MKKFLKLALCVVLVLGMIPVSVYSAFAQGKGVAKNDATNQSIDNALNQSIPETIYIDGELNDLGWKEWITVDSVNGVWNSETVSDEKKDFSYKYSLRRDHEYLYAAFDFGKGSLRDFNIYFSADNGVSVTTVSFSAENKTVGENEVELVCNGSIVEFSYKLGGEAASAATVSYYVSATFGENKLFYPAIYPDNAGSYVDPFYQWDSNAIKNIDPLPSYVNVDGMFNESYWTQLTTYHQGLDDGKNSADFREGKYDLVDFDTVRYSNTYYTNSGQTLSNSSSAKIRFKTDIRMDKDALFGSALVYVSSPGKHTQFRVFVHVNGVKYKFQIFFNATTQETNSALYKNGTRVEKLSEKTAAKISHGNSILNVEFKVMLSDLGIGSASNNVTVSVAALNDVYLAATGAYTYSTNNTDDTAGNAFSFNYAEAAKSDAGNGFLINGQLDTSIFAALLGYDSFLNGLSRDNGYGDVDKFAFALHADYENVYGAALVEMKDGEVWEKSKTANYTDYDHELFCLWVKSDFDSCNRIAAANRTAKDNAYSHVIKFFLNVNGEISARLIKVIGLKADGSVQTAEILTVLGKNDTNALLKEVEAVIKPVSEVREGFDTDDKRYAVEFKIPRYVLELDYDYVVKLTDSDNSQGSNADKKYNYNAAIRYMVSVESTQNGTSGTVGPVVSTSTGKFEPGEMLTSGTATLAYRAITPQVEADGLFSELVWNNGFEDEFAWNESFVNVNYANSTIANDTDKNLEFKYKLALGNEYLYGAAVVNNDDEHTQLAVWLKQEGYAAHDYAYRFVIKDGLFKGYSVESGEIYVNNGYWNEIEKGFLKYSAKRLNGKTYFEFTLDLDLFLARKDNTASIDIDFERPKFECFVAVETRNGEDSEKQMIHPAYSNTVLKGNASAYVQVDNAWEAILSGNAAVIEKLQHFAPEVIIIDGKLNDNGWDPNAWIEVSGGTNATIQGGNDDTYALQGNKAFTFKYQVRHDDEYLYVAALYYLPEEFSTEKSRFDEKTGLDEKGGNCPEFRIWINPKKEDGSIHKSFQYLYDVSTIDSAGVTGVVLPESIKSLANDPNYTPYASLTNVQKEKYGIGKWLDENGGFSTNAADGIIKYKAEDGTAIVLRAATNVLPDYANGGQSHPVTGKPVTYDRIYGASEFYGYTDIIQENRNSAKEWYADVENESYTLGKDHAIMCSGENMPISSVAGETVGTKNNAIVEFKVRISEFDPDNNGFEYSVQGSMYGYYSRDVEHWNQSDDEALKTLDYKIHYPAKYTETGSKTSYWGNYFPYWNWYNGIDFEDNKEESRLRNNCTPVVCLGAKVSETYKNPEDGKTYNAIRFGARYEEKYIRYLAGKEDGSYWDVKDMGIVVLPVHKLQEQNLALNDLALEVSSALNFPAENIVNWQKGKDVNGWSNFADYKNFVFYVTIMGFDERAFDMDFAFRGYMTFYTGTYYAGDEVIGVRDGMDGKTFYSDVLVRNFNEVKQISASENLPDGNYGENGPPVEIIP